MKRLIWSFKKFWGRKYRIIYTNQLPKDEILICGHKIYKGGEPNE